MVGHVAVRINVMGERGIRNEEATNADIDAMAAIVREGIDAGALGFSTSRVVNHKTANGDPVPGTYAHEDELFGIAAAMSDVPYCVFQLAQSGADGDGPEEALKELDWMRRLSAEFGLPVSFLVLQVQGAPDLWRELLDGAWDARRDGAIVVPQVANRPFGMLLGLTNRHPFVMRPTFAELARRHDSLDDLDALVAELSKPEVRAQILAEGDTAPTDDRFATIGMIAGAHAAARRSRSTTASTTSRRPSRSLAARAEAAGVCPLELFYDLMLEDGGRKRCSSCPSSTTAGGSHDAIYEMLTHPASVPGLGDGGAHLATICDASMPTYQLSHWVRGRTRGPKLSLEAAVKMQTHDTAELYGLGDRGTLEAGKKADLNLIDLDRLDLAPAPCGPRPPAEAARASCRTPSGYVATIVSGVVTRRDDRDTGARPGRLVRGARPA